MKTIQTSATSLQLVVALLAAYVGSAVLGAPSTAMGQRDQTRPRLMEVPQLRLDAEHAREVNVLEVTLHPTPNHRRLDVQLPAEEPPPAPNRVPPPLVHWFQDESAMDDIVLVRLWRL